MEDSLAVLNRHPGPTDQWKNEGQNGVVVYYIIYFLLEFGGCSPGEFRSPVTSRVKLGAPRNDLIS